MTRHLAARASRRGALGLLVAVTATGCSIDPPPDPPPGTSVSPGADEPEPADDPDSQLVRRVVDDLTAALALTGGIARAGRPLAAAVAPWRELHAAHLEALEATDRARPVRVRGPLSGLRARLRREETALQRRLAEAAVSARSGALAALLATMSAAVAQQLAADAAGGVAMSPVTALQRALAAEHAALHVYGTLGARTSASATPSLFADITAGYTTHRARRDQLTARVRDRGVEPVAAEPAYELPERLGTPALVTEAALAVERSCTATYAWLVGQTSGADRRWAVTALTQTAVRELTFRGSPEIFPGAGEHADR